ncbi:hypothetical protein D3C85_1027360 [compost metagenome]
MTVAVRRFDFNAVSRTEIDLGGKRIEQRLPSPIPARTFQPYIKADNHPGETIDNNINNWPTYEHPPGVTVNQVNIGNGRIDFKLMTGAAKPIPYSTR